MKRHLKVLQCAVSIFGLFPTFENCKTRFMCPKSNHGIDGHSASVGFISPGCTSVHLSWSFLSLWCGGTTSPWTSFMPRISSLEATALEISSKSSFLLFIHLSWSHMNSAGIRALQLKVFYSANFWWFAFNSWRKKETKSKSLQTWVSFLYVLIFSIRKSLIKI